jgi:hypothetical protein
MFSAVKEKNFIITTVEDYLITPLGIYLLIQVCHAY